MFEITFGDTARHTPVYFTICRLYMVLEHISAIYVLRPLKKNILAAACHRRNVTHKGHIYFASVRIRYGCLIWALKMTKFKINKFAAGVPGLG